MEIRSKSLVFRFVEKKDAEFILELRKNRGGHLSSTGDLRGQVDFIKGYKDREKKGEEFYFIISDKSGDIGVVRLYKINRDTGTFVWGSWILKKGSSPLYAVVSSLILYDFAFNHLRLNLGILDVRNENEKVISFHRKTGAVFTRKDELDHYFDFDRTAFEKFKTKYQKYLGSLIYKKDR